MEELFEIHHVKIVILLCACWRFKFSFFHEPWDGFGCDSEFLGACIVAEMKKYYYLGLIY